MAPKFFLIVLLIIGFAVAYNVIKADSVTVTLKPPAFELRAEKSK